MAATIQLDVNLWEQFSGFARAKRKKPNRQLEKLITEYRAMQKDLRLDEAMRQQARKSGFKESEAGFLVNTYRHTTRNANRYSQKSNG